MPALLALLACLGDGPATPSSALRLGPDVSIAIDGTSIADDTSGAPGMDDLIGQHLGALLAGATISTGGGAGTNGQNWRDMYAAPADVDARLTPGRHNILVCDGTINSVSSGRTYAQTLDDARRYIAARRAAGWDAVLVWGSHPHGHGDYAGTSAATMTAEAAINATSAAVDAYMADPAHWDDLGVDGFVDVRVIPQYAHDGTTAAAFQAYQSAWWEAPPSTVAWPTLGWIHPLVGTWPSGGSLGTGKRAIAALIGDVLKGAP